jgi:hypothetical protein
VQIGPGDILCCLCVRNESLRLPYFLEHYRSLGVSHFLVVDNDSDDGTRNLLLGHRDVSLWHTAASYRASRFGMDWLGWLLWRYGHGHWCVTVDADELLLFPDCDRSSLPALASFLEARGLDAMGALMLELFPKGPLGEQHYKAGDAPQTVIPYFDAYGYWAQRQPKMQNLWIQGGPRARSFFSDAPHRAPTLNKIPFVRWRRGYAYVNSTHNALPARLNRTYDEDGLEKPTGILLHTKFLPDCTQRARAEKQRGEHFAKASLYADYYDSVAAGPDLWHPGAFCFEGAAQLERLGLMQRGGWGAE